MSRHTTFRFCLDPTVEQHKLLVRYAGASRFAFNQCLQMVKSALDQHGLDTGVSVPWTGFDLINTFNTWKKSEAAGRVFAVDTAGTAHIVVTGLVWRAQVYQQVFEEAAVDLGRGLKAWLNSKSGKRKRVGFPRFKKKAGHKRSFRLRNRHFTNKPSAIRLGEGNRPRSVTLPGIGQIAVHDDTRRLRRMLAQDRAKILFATITHAGGRWWVALNVEAAHLHAARQHVPCIAGDRENWVGVDRGLSAFVVAATAEGTEVARITDAPKALGRNHASIDLRTSKQRGRIINARRRDGADQHPRVGETGPNEAGTDVRAELPA